MATEIITGIISLVGIILSAVVSLQLVNWRLKKLEDKVDVHNSYSDKIGSIQTDIAVIKNTLQHLEKEKDK